ncbi:MAG: PQQ-binding-like beta-propeller repeat protein [Bacteroidota bacterium]
MKYFICFLVAFQFVASAQNLEPDKTTLFINLIDNNKQPVPFFDILLIDKETKAESKIITNIKGKAELTVVLGKTYSVNFRDVQNHSEISVPAKYTGNLVKTIVYSNVVSTATNLKVDTVFQNYATLPKATATTAAVNIVLQNESNLALPNVAIKLSCPSINRVFTGKTNNKGEAYFLLPINNSYAVSVAEISNYDNVYIPNRNGIVMTKKIRYIPTNVNEISKGDTIIQNLQVTEKATSARVLVSILILDLEKNKLPNENIYLNIKGTSQVYVAKTNAQGKANLLLPKGKKYDLSFQYERNVDVLDYSLNDNGIRNTEIEYSYVGSKKIEEHYKAAKKTKDGFVIEFMSIPTTRINAFNQQKVTKNENGFEINFGSTNPVNSPAIHNDLLFLSEGFQSKNFYCFNSTTGKFVWGQELTESGASSAVVADEIVLINTYSCTLYALDCKSGKLLWSKWLGSSIFSTPTVADGKVYVTYPNDIYSGNKKNKYVLTAFNLKTGEVEWQNWLDSEALASAVVSGLNVFVTSLEGTLYSFNKTNGKLEQQLLVNAVTPPTISESHVYCFVNESQTSEKINLIALDKNDFKKQFAFLNCSTNFSIKEFKNSSPNQLMNYTNCRPVISRDKLYVSFNNNIKCIDLKTNNELWNYNLNINSVEKVNLMPLVLEDRIIVASADDKITSYTLNFKPIQSFTIESVITEPIAHNGWIYSGSSSGKLFAINTNDKLITGWQMWGANALHNPFFKSN